MLPVAYVETSVISYLVAQPSRDLVIAARQQLTRDWWTSASTNYGLRVSELVLREAQRGDPFAAERRLAALQGMEAFGLTAASGKLTQALVAANAVPASAAADALHIALAVVHGADMLVTWNFKHIANPFTWPTIWGIVEAAGWNVPILCTPAQLMEEGL